MTLSDLLPPERVREIIEESLVDYPTLDDHAIYRIVNAAAPEIARAALEMAARRLDDEDSTNASAIVRAFSKEITDAK